MIERLVYSVWSTWARRDVVAYAGVDEITLVFVGDARVVVHPRQPFGGRSVDYRHYVRELARKPQALRQVADELIAALDEPFAAAWRMLVDQHGPKQAARLFAQVLGAIEARGEQARSRWSRSSGERPGLVVTLACGPPHASPARHGGAASRGTA
jgi:hypothetical protein